MQQANIPRLYQETCASCHGGSGEGGGSGTKTLLTESQFSQAYDKPYFDAIKNGVPDMGMEAFGQTLRDNEIWGLVVYIRELQARALRSRNPGPKPNGSAVVTGQHHKYRSEVVIGRDQGLRTPWAVDWLPDGRMLVTNRNGRLDIWANGRLTEVAGMPEIIEVGQGGLMDVAVHPSYRTNGWIYMGYSEPAEDNDGRKSFTVVSRFKLGGTANAPAVTGLQVLWRAAQENYNGSGLHFGNRIVFDGKGHIFFCIGERGNAPLSQDLTKPNGKVYRIKEDGTVPADNPFADPASKAKGFIPAVWSYGHRNPQGLVLGLDGRLWVTEHGPRGGDELNEVKRGANYGWPVRSFSMNYNGAPLTTPWPDANEKFAMPAYRWMPSIGACGLDVVKGAAFPKWRGDLVAGGLSGQNVDRIRVKDGKMVEREEIVFGLGRVRDVVVSPQGHVYVVLNQPDMVVRLVPAQ